MNITETQAKLADFLADSGTYSVSVVVTASKYMTSASLIVYETEDYKSATSYRGETVDDMIADAMVDINSDRRFAVLRENMAEAIINQHFKTGTATRRHLVDRFGEKAVAENALYAVVIANERMNPATPMVLIDV